MVKEAKRGIAQCEIVQRSGVQDVGEFAERCGVPCVDISADEVGAETQADQLTEQRDGVVADCVSGRGGEARLGKKRC